jgi:competence protein ComEC
LLVVLFALGIVLGVWRLRVAVPGNNSIAHATGKYQSLTGIIEKRESGNENQKITLGSLSIEGREFDDKLLLFVPLYPKAELGAKVGVRCEVEAPEAFDGFAYDRYLAAKHIYATCRMQEAPFILEHYARNNPFIEIRKLHDGVVESIQKKFGEPQAQLLSGLLIGDDNFSDHWKEKFMRTGTSHVVAASGYNVALVSSLALAALIYLGLRRQYAYPFVLAAIAAFVILAGGEAAVTRAGIMGAVALTATQVGRKGSMRNVILLVVSIMLLQEPRILRDDAGFQLSVLSTIGLILLSKPIAKKLDFIPETFSLRESFACTLAATIFTLPVIIFGFGRISLVGPLTNLLVLPFLPYAMAAGVFGMVTGITLPAWFFLEVILKIIEAMAALPFAVITL